MGRGLLSKEQVDFFNENGFIFVPGFLDSGQIEQVRGAIDHACRAGVERTFPKHSRNSYGIDDAYEKIPALAWLEKEPRLISILKQLLGDDIVSTNDSGVSVGHINKVWHKDNQYDKKDEVRGYELDWKPDFKVIRIIFYLDEHQTHSGALGVKAGSHKIQDLKGGKPRMVTNGPGDLALFDVRITHAGNMPVPRPGFKWIPVEWLRPRGYAYRDYNPFVSKAFRKAKMVFFDSFVRLPIFYPFHEKRTLVIAEYGANNWQSQRWSDNRTNSKGLPQKKITPVN